MSDLRKAHPYKIRRTEDSIILHLFEEGFLGSPDDEKVIKIPFSGELGHVTKTDPDFFSHYVDGIEILWDEFPAVIVSIVPAAAGPDVFKAYLLWIEERGEWVIIEYLERTFTDGSGGYSSYDGPCSLDEILAKELLKAYGISPSKMSLEKIRKTSPEDFERMSPKPKIQRELEYFNEYEYLIRKIGNLENSSDEDLIYRIKNFLAEGHSERFLIYGKDTNKSTILLQYYSLSPDSSFKRRFKSSISKLMNFWRESIDSLDYLAEILAIVERLKIDNTYSRLLVLAKNENLKGQTGLGVDLHFQILKVLFGFGIDENRQDLEFIIARDIKDPRYATLCFKRSWEMELRRGIDNLPLLLKCYHEDQSIDAKGALKEFFEELGPERFAEEFPGISQELDVYLVDFIQLLDSIGVKPLFSDTEEKKKYDMILRFPYEPGILDFEKFIEDLNREISLRELMNKYMESLFAAIPSFGEYLPISIFPFDYAPRMKAFSRIFLLSKELKDRINEFNKEETEKIGEIIQALEREARLYERERFPYRIFHSHQFDEISTILRFSNHIRSPIERDLEKFKLENHMILIGWSGTGKTRSLIKIAENFEPDLIVVIEDNVRSIGVETLYNIRYLGECIVIWDDIEYSMDEFLEALPIIRELKDIRFMGAIQPIDHGKLEDNKYFREMQFEKVYMGEFIDKETEKLENKARSLIANQNYLEARSTLKEVFELASELQESLQREFGFLYNFTTSAQKDKKHWNENKELIEWRKNLWYILSDKNNFPLKITEKLYKNEEEEVLEESSDNGYVKTNLTPPKKGEFLEGSVLELFRKFFIIAEEDESKLQELRQQKKGIQFGHDISFECTVKGNENVKCHIECKNKESDITPRDITDKLESTEAFCPDIDHWILVSPHSNPSNQLKLLLDSWKKKRRYSFSVQVWCPETGVREFFGLNPTIYNLFYESKEGEIRPSEWTEEKRRKVFETWKEKLKPMTRLPQEWDEYIRDDSWIFIEGDRTTVLKNLYEHYVPMRCMDERRNIIGQTLEQYMLKWLKDINTSIMFLLGEFGNGKTAFTYILSRNLANEFLENPSEGWIPVRFALRDYHSAGSSREFLRRRLEEFRSDIASWKKLKERYNLLVILDGLDEMTKKLDSKTVTQNIKDLIDCCEEFEGLKILITSRRHFFENQKNVKRLLQRLPPNRICYLVPIDRRTTIKHLEEHAAKLGEEKKLKSICKLHDPIGLASKPLFLQMVKETLNKLPEENLNEVILYETYIEESLTRKKKSFDDADLKVPPGEIYSNLIGILEEVALRLQASKENYVLLEEFVSTDKQNLAELLWKMSESDEVIDELVEEKEEAVEDITARVGVRSLLTRIKTNDDTHKWPVDFCHRSMREYFVARGICRALHENKERAKELLAKLPLNHEILYFAAELMGQENPREYESTLLSLIKSTKGTKQCGTLGGNAVTILYRLKGELPEDDWSELNLDGADLSGADLSNKNFFATSLQYANLDNVNFEGADFRNCILTGVRIEETASVLAVTTNYFGDRIIAAYGDNTIREWNISQRLKNEWKTIGRNTNGFINWIGTSPDSSLCALTNEEVIFYDFEDQGKLLERARFRMKPEYRQVVVKENNLLLVSEKEHDPNKVLLIDLKQQKIRRSVKLEKVALCENLDGKTFVLSEEGTSLRIVEITNSSLESAITLSAHEVTSLCVFCCNKNSRYLLACGQRNGEVFVWQIDFFRGKWKGKVLLKRHDHDDSVSSLAFLDDSRIISGSVDRRMFIIRFGSDTGGTRGKKENKLHLTAKCRGMKIEGVKRDRERRMLETLISKAQ